MSNKKDILYEFENVGHGDEDGFNDPMRTAFDTNISRTVARESIQNILDASASEPARATFDLLEPDIKVLPDLPKLKQIMDSCKKHFSSNKGCVAHFNHILEILKRDKIHILKIGDYNTRGLSGEDNDRAAPYYCFLKSVGASSKGGQEGGSFGLGKGSFYAASALNTIIVSSIYKESKATKYVFQGKLRLVSHKASDRSIKRGNGSLGLVGEKPVRDPNSIPLFYRREEVGTDIYIMAYRDVDNWKTNIIRSVLNNFWYSIMKNRLTVKIEEIEICAGNLSENMYYHFGDDSVHENNPITYYETLLNGTKYEETLPTIGDVQLYLLKKRKKQNKVACFRKTGMLIQEKNFASPVPYSGVFICDNDKGNKIFRDMESPNHDKWDKNSAHSKIDSEPRPVILKADNEYKKFIKRRIRDLINVDTKKEMNIGGLEKYLFLPTEEEFDNEFATGLGSSLKDSDEETPIEIGMSDNEREEQVKRDPVVVVSPKVERGESDDSADPESRGTGEDGGGGGSGNGGGGNHEGTGGGANPDGPRERTRKVLNIKYRSFASLNASNQTEHWIIIRDGSPKAKCLVKVIAGTDDSFDDNIKIEKASNLDGTNCSLSGDNELEGIILDKNGEKKIKLKFDSNDKYSLKVVAYED